MSKYDLGGNDGSTRYEIDTAFRTSNTHNTLICYICSNPASHKLIAKLPNLNTDWLLNYGFICVHCLNTTNTISPDEYGIREL